METPDLKLTMLGATSSGKTTFMLGMYNTLAVGMHNYFIFTEDPDDDVELREIWEDLLDNGILPAATRENENKYYRSVFNHGFTPLLSIDYLTEGQGAWELKKADYSASRSAARQQLAELNQGFMAIFRGQRIAAARGRMVSIDDALERGHQEYAANQSLIERLAQELAGHPMIRSGKVER